MPNLEDWKSQNTVFEGISAYLSTSFNLEGGDTPQRIPGMQVSANYFDVLGVKPTLGRGFLPGEDVAGNERVVVLSDEVWRRNFAANPAIVNQTIPLNGQKYQTSRRSSNIVPRVLIISGLPTSLCCVVATSAKKSATTLNWSL